MGVISVAVAHAVKLGASAIQIQAMVEAMENELPSLVRLPDVKHLDQKISQEKQEISSQDKQRIISLQESISAIVPNALVQESICEIRQKRRKRQIIKDSEEFTAFWNICPRRIAKGHARKSWARAVETAGVDEIFRGMERYASLCRKNGTEEQFIAFPSTWLNQERWLDETVKKESKFTGSSNVYAWETEKANFIEKNGVQAWYDHIKQRRKARENDTLVRGNDQGPQGVAGPKEPKLARLSDVLPPLPPMDDPKENQTTLLEEAIPDEVFIRRDEREFEPIFLPN